MRLMTSTLLAAAAVAILGCPTSTPTNPFFTLTENFGAQSGSGGGTPGGGGGGGTTLAGTFRSDATVTLVNVDTEAELNVSLAAWVSAASIRDADQQDALFASGYRQLSATEQLGSAFTLGPGTFVLGGPGLAGALLLTIPPGGTETIDLVTPDVLLLFSAPPISCESVAFTFTIDGFPLETVPAFAVGGGTSAPISANTGATGALGLKTLAQVDAYQCQPFLPGLFFQDALPSGVSIGGGNTFSEGANITVTFGRVPTVEGAAALVEINE